MAVSIIIMAAIDLSTHHHHHHCCSLQLTIKTCNFVLLCNIDTKNKEGKTQICPSSSQPCISSSSPVEPPFNAAAQFP
jgi:hypothetical protein